MNLWIILAIVAVICLLNRGPRHERRSRCRRTNSHDRAQPKDAEIDRLNARVTTLEEILLDRDRRLRDQFRGL
ncbi:MAG: hypothetical protein AAF292_17295 [Pseudomonadota bacterium]